MADEASKESITEPTCALLTRSLRSTGRLEAGEVVAVELLERFDGFATAIRRCGLVAGPGARPALPATVVVKIYGPDWYARAGRQDLAFYRAIAPALPEPLAPALLGAIDEPGAETCMLVLEDLSIDYTPLRAPATETWLPVVADTLARLHAAWWDHPRLSTDAFLTPHEDVTRMAQALAPTGLQANLAAAAEALAAFRRQHATELAAEDHALLDRLAGGWAPRFGDRVQRGSLTLLHGDFHLLGNVFVPKAPGSGLRVIDWAQAKRGLGPHDLMYALMSVEAADRPARDRALLARYHAALGVAGYDWDQCLWDYRFSILTNLFQSVFQGSLVWFRRTAAVARAWEAAELLDVRPR